MAATLGERLRELRTAKGLSQTSLAAGIASASYVSLIESDRRTPERDIVEALARRLGTTPEYLETGIEAGESAESTLALRYAELALANGQTAEAIRGFRELTASRIPRIRLAAEWGLACALESSGKLEQAIAKVERLREYAREDQLAEPSLLRLSWRLCRLYREVGDLNHSIEVGESALAEMRSLGIDGTDEEVDLASTLVFSYWERGDWSRASALADQTIARAEELGSRHARGAAYWNASVVADSRGRTAVALELAERALALYAESDDERHIAGLRTTYAWLLLRHDPPQVDKAEELLARAHEKLAEAGTEVELAHCETELARCQLFRGRLAEATRLVRDAMRRLPSRQVQEAARARLVYGQVLVAGGDREAGLQECRRAAEQLSEMGANRQAMVAWREIGDLFDSLGQHSDSMAAYRALADCAGARSVPMPGPHLASQPARLTPSTQSTGSTQSTQSTGSSGSVRSPRSSEPSPPASRAGARR